MITRGLVAAMENENVNNPAPADDTAVEVATAATELSDEIVDVTEAHAEGEASEAQVEEATEVAEALESLAEAVGVAAQNGGLDRHAAAVTKVALEHMYARVGISAQAMPALESFGGTATKAATTVVAMEDIKEQAAKIWKAIVEAVKKAIAWATDFFNKIFGTAEKLEKRADALQSKVEGITGAAKNKSFESEGLVKKLHVNGELGTGIVSDVAKIQATAKQVFADANTFAGELGEEIVKAMGTEGAEKTFVATFTIPAGGMPGKEVSNPESAGFSAAPEGLTLFRTEELPGGMAIVGYGAKSELKGEAAVNAMRGIGAKVQPFGGSKAAAPSKKDVATLSTQDMVKVCKTVSDISALLKGYRTAQAKLTEMKKKFAAAAEKAAKSASGAESEAKDGFKAMAKVASQYPRFIDQPAASFSVYTVNAAKAALDYVEASTKQYA
jgi:hypothetical protein